MLFQCLVSNFCESLNLDGFLPIIATAMKQNKYFCMSGAVNRQDESALQRLKDKLVGEAKKVLKTTNDDKGRPRESCYSEEERAGIKALKSKRIKEGMVVCHRCVEPVRGGVAGQLGSAHQGRPHRQPGGGEQGWEEAYWLLFSTGKRAALWWGPWSGGQGA